MIFKPQKQPKKAGTVAVILYATAAGLFLISQFLKPPFPYQLMALIIISIALFITSRYILTDYKYVIRDAERASDKVSFTIVKINGSREAIMANFDLISVYAFEKCKKISDFEKKYGKVNKFYGYTSNFSSPDTYMMGIEFNQMKVLFAIEADENFAREIMARTVLNAPITNQNDKNERGN